MADYYMYIDESGDLSYPFNNGSRETRFYILTGYILPNMQINELYKTLNQIRINALVPVENKITIPIINVVLHASQLFNMSNPKSIFVNLTLEERYKIYTRSLKGFLDEFPESRLFSVAVDKLELYKVNHDIKTAQYIMKYFCWYHLPARFERFLYYSGKDLTGKVIAESTYNNFVRDIFDRKKQNDIVRTIYGNLNIPWNHIEKEPTFKAKKHISLQFADLFAYAVKYYLDSDNGRDKCVEVNGKTRKLSNVYNCINSIWLRKGTEQSNDAIYRYIKY